MAGEFPGFEQFAQQYVKKPEEVQQISPGAEYARGVPEQQLMPPQAPAPTPVVEQQAQRTFADPASLAQMNIAQGKYNEAIASQAAAESEVNKQRAQAYMEQNKVIERRQSELESLMNEYKGAKIVDPMDSWGAGRKIGAAIAMGLGAYASAMTGTKNFASDIIHDSIKRDMDLQEAKINKLGLDAKAAQGALADATRKLGDIGQARTALEIAALQNANEDIMKAATATDNAKVKANANTFKASNDMKIAELKAHLNKNVVSSSIVSSKSTGGAGASVPAEKSMTEAQGKAYSFARTMDSAERDLSEVESYGATMGGAAAGILPEAIKPETRKKYDQAAGAWSEAYIRWASGANVPEKEISSTLKRSLPAAGDSPKILEQKRAYRQQLSQTLWKISGQKPESSQSNDIKKQVGFQ